MTRIEKYKVLREQIAKENVENSVIWDTEKTIQKFQSQFVKIDKNYFAPVFEKINSNLQLLNLENTMIRNDYQYLKEKDKFKLKKINEELNISLENILQTSETLENDHTIIQNSVEYKVLIENIHQKAIEFEKDLASKINDINVFVQNLEQKHLKLLGTETFEKNYDQLKSNINKLQEDYQQLRVKAKINFKSSFISFFLVITSLLVITVILIVILMLK